MIDRKSLSVSAGTHQQLERLATKLGLSHKDLITAMVQYFTVTRADPRDPKADTPDVALKKMAAKVDILDKRLIGFIREQEKELLKPLLSEVKAMRTQIGGEVATPGVGADQLEEQLTSVVGAIQTLLRMSFRTALVDSALRPEYIQQTDKLIQQENNSL